MSKPQKEKRDYTEAFEWLYADKNIEGNAGLLRKMFLKYYKSILDKDVDCQNWVNKQLPDFGKKIKGGRAFTESDIKAIERAVEMSWVDITEPITKEKKEHEQRFKPSGIRYAAYIDEEGYYEELSNQTDIDDYQSALFNCDEYEKSIIDYLLEYKAEKGLRFMVKKGYIYCYGNDTELQGYAYRTNEHSEELWAWILSIDDEELYSGLMKNVDFSQRVTYSDRSFIESILNSEGFLSSLCKEREHPSNAEIKYMPLLLLDVLKLALEKGMRIAAQRILTEYTRFIDERVAEFKNNDITNGKKKFRTAGYNGGLLGIYYTRNISMDYGEWSDEPIVYVWDFSDISQDKRVGFENQIEYCEHHSIMKRLEIKELSAMEYGDSFVREGVSYIKMKPDVSLEALIYLTRDKGCRYLPEYLGEEEGVTMVKDVSRIYGSVDMRTLGEMLAEIHSMSQEKLGEGKVYKYSGGFCRDTYNCFGRVDNVPIIKNWRRCEIGTPTDDLANAFINLSSRYSHTQGADEIGNCDIESLTCFLEGYGNKSVLADFGDRFNDFADARVHRAIEEKKPDGIRAAYSLKSFAEINRDKLNELTKIKGETI